MNFPRWRRCAAAYWAREECSLKFCELPTADLKVFLRTWVHRKAYCVALARGDRRVNLDESDAGPEPTLRPLKN